MTEKNLRLEKMHLYSYLAEDLVELLNTWIKFKITISTNLATDKLLVFEKTRMEAEKANKRINS